MRFNLTQDAYLSLRNIIAERTSPVVAWVGSGLSAPLLPTWAGLKQRLITAFEEKIETFAPSERTALRRKLAAIVEQSNLWIAFDMIEKALGATTFHDTIRETLRPAETADPPASYLNLWNLRIRGLITLNIDRLATKAYSQSNAKKILRDVTGAKGTQLGYLLKENRPFVLNLHGHADDLSSWIFTKSKLSELMRTPSYSEFIRSCLLTNTVIFLGLSADDLSVGGHLKELAKRQIRSGTHYWITSRMDVDTDSWAEAVGLRVIRYEAPGDDHSAVDEMFEDLITFVPPEDPPETLPVVSDSASSSIDGLLSPEELANKDAEVIRQTLNSYVHHMLSTDVDANTRYLQFRQDYDEAIYRAWYVSTEPDRNRLMDYTIESRAAQGAFGTVYRATTESGEPLAIKVLLEEIRNNEELLQSFRRGVRSMKILSKHGLEGVVAYRDFSEIPAFVVMDWVDGPSLQEAVESKMVGDWGAILRVARYLARILRRSHELPERVLHRDLRPSNVMLKGFYTDPDDWRVVVLDFDLSWHRGATEKSVVHGSTLFGYLAPEQIQRIRGVSTRHSAIDSFGLGMTLFFTVSGRHPIPAEHRHTSWPETVQQACLSMGCERWKSLPGRFARLILSATADQQSRRWDLAQIETELSRLLEAEKTPERVEVSDLLIEEIAARTGVLGDHMWNDDTDEASWELPTGLRVALGQEATSRRLVLRVDKESTGVHQYKKVSKWLVPAGRSCSEILRSAGWSISSSQIDTGVLRLRAEIDLEFSRGRLVEMATTLDRAMGHLRLN